MVCVRAECEGQSKLNEPTCEPNLAIFFKVHYDYYHAGTSATNFLRSREILFSQTTSTFKSRNPKNDCSGAAIVSCLDQKCKNMCKFTYRCYVKQLRIQIMVIIFCRKDETKKLCMWRKFITIVCILLAPKIFYIQLYILPRSFRTKRKLKNSLNTPARLQNFFQGSEQTSREFFYFVQLFLWMLIILVYISNKPNNW